MKRLCKRRRSLVGPVCALAAALGWQAAAPVRATAAAVACESGSDSTAMLNRAVAAGGEVRIAAGICRLSGSLMVPSNTTLMGAGIGKTVLRAARGGAFNVVQIGGGTLAPGSTNVTISGLTIDGSATAGGAVPHESSGVLVSPASSDVRMRGIEVRNAADNGIDISGSRVDVTDSLVHDNWHNGIYVMGRGTADGSGRGYASYVRILRNRVSRNSLQQPPGTAPKTWDGIDLDPRHAYCVVDGNVLEDNDILLLDPGPRYSGPDQVSNNTITDPGLTLVDASGGDGIDVAGRIDGFRITGNRILGVRHFGIIVGGPARNGLISSNVIRGTTAEGILLRTTVAAARGAPQNIEVSRNSVWPGPAARGRAAIAVRHMPGVRVIGNIMDVPAGETGQPGTLDLRQAGPGLVAQGNR